MVQLGTYLEALYGIPEKCQEYKNINLTDGGRGDF